MISLPKGFPSKHCHYIKSIVISQAAQGNLYCFHVSLYPIGIKHRKKSQELTKVNFVVKENGQPKSRRRIYRFISGFSDLAKKSFGENLNLIDRNRIQAEQRDSIVYVIQIRDQRSQHPSRCLHILSLVSSLNHVKDLVGI